MFVLSAIQTLTFVLIGNSILEIKGMYVDYWFVLFTTSCFANMLGLNISASFNSAVTIYILIPFLIIPQLLLSGVIVKFDKLNPKITSQSDVPLTGEVMTSRWAFEALAVNQFKKNEYEKRFYVLDKKISIANFKKDSWLKQLRAKVDNCLNIYQDITTHNNKSRIDELKYDLTVLHDEIKKEMGFSNIPFEGIDMLTPEKFNNVIGAQLKTYFDSKIQKNYMRLENNARAEVDAIKVAAIRQIGNDTFNQLKSDYDNESLDDLVKNAKDLDKIVEVDGKLIQRFDPVFLDPSKSSFISAHFFAPRKRLFGQYMDTFWVNMIVIWSMSLTLAITLYFDLLKKLLDFFGDFSSRFKRKKKE